MDLPAQLAGLVKFSHSIFALPFALAAMLLAMGGLPPARLVLLILLCMITLRNAAMAFNRYLDAEIDARNPRTATRHIPSGLLSKNFVLFFAMINAFFFILATSWINPLSFNLAFPALGLACFYSFTKRITALSHLILGSVLGISPVGAWIAVTGEISFLPVLLGIAVIFWVAGFDLIYATQDFDFDKKQGLHSLAVALGIRGALFLSKIFHLITLLLLLWFGQVAILGGIYYVSWLLIAGLFVYEHSLVKADDLSRVNAAFFNVNGIISLIFLAGVALSL